MSSDGAVKIPPWICERFPADQRAGVDHFRRLIDEEMLKEIAAADYDQETEEHLAALEPVWSGAPLEPLDAWYPREVLELIRWSEPEDPEWKPGSTGLRGHVIRAFSCAVLLATPNFEPDTATLIQLIDSARHLGPDAMESTGRFLTWKIDAHHPPWEERPFFALALAALIRFSGDDLMVSREQELADWVNAEEATQREYLSQFSPHYKTGEWLFGLSFGGMRDEKWRALLHKMKQLSSDRPLGIMLAEHYPE